MCSQELRRLKDAGELSRLPGDLDGEGWRYHSFPLAPARKLGPRLGVVEVERAEWTLAGEEAAEDEASLWCEPPNRCMCGEMQLEKEEVDDDDDARKTRLPSGEWPNIEPPWPEPSREPP